ncbi:MAG: 2-phosphosulfolactate phosphatase [Gemmataceae bacterium]|nr:2-phosphosulfolactate phosphatase [Gemmataceae bacterium]
MGRVRDIRVSLTPDYLATDALSGSTAVAIDVLRATSTMLTALAAGARAVIPCATIEEARSVSVETRWAPTLLAGERAGRKIDGFDLGNSPAEFNPGAVKGKTIICTTTNGTLAILACRRADRVLIGAFVNFSTVCEQLAASEGTIHLVCAGTDGQPTLEDTLFAGAVIDYLSATGDINPNDAGRMAWDSFENHGRILSAAFEVSAGGDNLIRAGLAGDLKLCAAVDKLAIGAEVRFDPPRIEVATAGIKRQHWPHKNQGSLR